MHKVAILELVAACVDHQPGLTQLLLDINPGVSLVVEPAPVHPAQLAGKRSCEHILVLPHLRTLSYLVCCESMKFWYGFGPVDPYL
jgi:hypothetical protein